jgi:high affinity Mn2+ porin
LTRRAPRANHEAVLSRRAVVPALALIACLSWSSRARADGDDDDDAYLLPHPDARWWLSGQLNVIGQAHGRFDSRYEGPHSLHHGREGAVSLVGTIFAGYQVTDTTELLVDGESAGGGGISDAVGLGGFTNLDVVRNPTLGAAPYLARVELHQIIALSDARVAVARGPLRGFSSLPARRLELRAGKMSTVDTFDQNGPGSDSHLQFMNWTADNNGAYDYAADTRGYTLGAVIEYQDVAWGARFAEMLMPTVANGIDYDFDLAHARGEQLEVEWREHLGGRPGVIRGLVFWNHARMGNYADAIARGLAPVIEDTRAPGRTKLGFGLNGEHEVADGVRVFGRAGWSDGKNESFAYTEVDNTLELGADSDGARWSRPDDRVALVMVSNGLSPDHRDYLARGGQGFLLGDGNLRYGRESFVEAYYTARAYRGVSPSADVQAFVNPGYNADRGPVVVGSLRVHADF